MRRRPKQNRGLKTYEQILASAIAILSDEGLTELNTNRIAERAGVNIATVYSYFPNKDQILATLAERFEGQRSAYVEDAAKSLPEVTNWEEWFCSMIDRMVRFRTDEPGGAVIRHTMLVTPELRRFDEASTKRSADAKIPGLMAHGRGLTRAEASEISLTSTATVTAVLDEAFRTTPYNARMVEELKKMTIAHLRIYLVTPILPR